MRSGERFVVQPVSVVAGRGTKPVGPWRGVRSNGETKSKQAPVALPWCFVRQGVAFWRGRVWFFAGRVDSLCAHKAQTHGDTAPPAARQRVRVRRDGGNTMLWTIIAILVVLWLLGFSIHVGGGLIHLL